MREPKPWTPADIEAMQAYEARQLARGVCPWSGLALTDDGQGSMRCSICDCHGIDPERVKKS